MMRKFMTGKRFSAVHPFTKKIKCHERTTESKTSNSLKYVARISIDRKLLTQMGS
jgi:hypothetical protein